MAVPSDSLAQVAPQTEGDQPPIDETRIASRWGIVLTRFRRKRLAMFGLVMLVLMFALAWLLLRGRFGRALRALRDSEVAAVSSGIRLSIYKTVAFAISVCEITPSSTNESTARI